MACISPLAIRHQGQRFVVPCGKCLYCLEANRAQWTFRIRQELKRSQSASFLTFTYTDEDLPRSDCGWPEVRKDHFQGFMKRLRKVDAQNWRKVLPRSKKVPSLRYYSVAEYSPIDRPHYHSIMMNLHPTTLPRLETTWGKGFVDIGSVSEASIHYVTKYVVNRYGDYSSKAKPFALISQGIGKNYSDANAAWHKTDVPRNFAMQDGFKVKLPRYYAEKIFDGVDKARIRTLLEQVRNQKFADDMSELSRLHSDPLAYIIERRASNYELAVARSLKENKKSKQF